MLGQPWHAPTDLCHHDGCRCPGAKEAPGHQQPPCSLSYDYNITWTISCNIFITLQPFNKLCCGEVWRSTTHGFFFSCDQAALRTLLSVPPSVRLSICHTFLTVFLSSYHSEIFSIHYHWQTWCPCKRSRSKVKVTEVMTPFHRFQTVTKLQFEFTYGDEMVHKTWCCLEEVPYIFWGHPSNFKVTLLKKSSILTHIGRFRTVTPV